MKKVTANFYNKDFWIQENSLYKNAHFRHLKCARIVNTIAQGRQCDLLDLGCGPAVLRKLLDPNINYHGIDLALHESAPYLIEGNFMENEIRFGDKRFDIVVALGVFEYSGKLQSQKFSEIKKILNKGGKFVMSYVNFSHFRKIVWPIYNNVQPINEMKKSLEQVFTVERCFPISHHWRHKQPGKNALPAIQMHINFAVPLISRWLAVDYFFVCSPRE